MSDTTPTAGRRVAEDWYGKAMAWVDPSDINRLAADIDAAIAQARREGAEAMREAAAKLCDEELIPIHRLSTDLDRAYNDGTKNCAELIRTWVQLPAPADTAQPAEQHGELTRAQRERIGYWTADPRFAHIETPLLAEFAEAVLADPLLAPLPPDLARDLAEARAQLAAAERRLARWADAIEGHVLAALLERGEQGDGELWDDVQAYRREQTDEGKNDESR